MIAKFHAGPLDGREIDILDDKSILKIALPARLPPLYSDKNTSLPWYSVIEVTYEKHKDNDFYITEPSLAAITNYKNLGYKIEGID